MLVSVFSPNSTMEDDDAITFDNESEGVLILDASSSFGGSLLSMPESVPSEIPSLLPNPVLIPPHDDDDDRSSREESSRLDDDNEDGFSLGTTAWRRRTSFLHREQHVPWRVFIGSFLLVLFVAGGLHVSHQAQLQALKERHAEVLAQHQHVLQAENEQLKTQLQQQRRSSVWNEKNKKKQDSTKDRTTLLEDTCQDFDDQNCSVRDSLQMTLQAVKTRVKQTLLPKDNNLSKREVAWHVLGSGIALLAPFVIGALVDHLLPGQYDENDDDDAYYE